MYFFFRKVSPFTYFEVAEAYFSYGNACKLKYLDTVELAHASYLAVSALEKLELCDCAAVLCFRDLGDADTHGLLAVYNDRLAKHSKLLFAKASFYCNVIDLGDRMARMGKLIGKLAVIGEQKQAVRIHIESAYWIYSDGCARVVLDAAYKLGHVNSAFFIARGTHNSARLVEHNAYFFVALRCYSFAAIGHLVNACFYLVAKLCRLSVDPNLALFDSRISRAP